MKTEQQNTDQDTKMSEKDKRNRQIYQQSVENPLFFGMNFCEEHFRMDSAPFQLQILLEALKNQFSAVASPRESAKSTILAFLVPLHSICFQKMRFILIVSNTYKKAAGSLDTIKWEIMNNPKVKNGFRIDVIRDAEGDSIFKHPDGFEIRVLCKGAEQIGSVRGEKFGAYRPDLIIVDDLEDDELVRNPDRRQILRDLYDEALIPAGEKGKVKVLAIGTILHDDSLMAKLVSTEFYPEYKKIFLKALNGEQGNYESLWPEKWSVEDLLKIQREKPNVFAKEYQNNPVAGILGKFYRKDFRYWSTEGSNYLLFDTDRNLVAKDNFKTCRAAIACDLAWEEKKVSDFGVIMPGFLTANSDLLIYTYICKKGLKPDEISEILFILSDKLKGMTGTPVPIGFEKSKLEKVVEWFLKREMRKRNKFLITKPLEWHGDKIERVVSKLQPRYAQHTVYHLQNMGDLEHQLLRFPSGIHDDLPDAEQGLVQLLEIPKRKKTIVSEQNEFMWWREQAIKARKPHRSKYIFGQKLRPFEIPAKVAYR